MLFGEQYPVEIVQCASEIVGTEVYLAAFGIQRHILGRSLYCSRQPLYLLPVFHNPCVLIYSLTTSGTISSPPPSVSAVLTSVEE